jgi:hypothetical protein
MCIELTFFGVCKRACCTCSLVCALKRIFKSVRVCDTLINALSYHVHRVNCCDFTALDRLKTGYINLHHAPNCLSY